MFSSSKKTVRFRLHRWGIEIHAEVPRYIQMLRTNLSYYLNNSSRNKRTKTSELRKIRFNIYHRTEKEKWMIPVFNQKKFYQWKHYGICQNVNSETGDTSVFINAKRKIPNNVIYHAGFLHPLFLNLLPSRATLIHASLVSKQNSGILIVGRSGAGKSTLSVAFLNHGFNYFSDEHPIVELCNGKIIGRNFINRVGLPSLSAKNFPAFKKSFKWNANIRKFDFNPWTKNESLPETCSIDKILFPKFQPRSVFSIRRLKPLELFRELTQDDYFFIDTQDDFKNKLGQNHLKIMLELANGRKGFAVNYGPADIGNLPATIENL